MKKALICLDEEEISRDVADFCSVFFATEIEKTILNVQEHQSDFFLNYPEAVIKKQSESYHLQEFAKKLDANLEFKQGNCEDAILEKAKNALVIVLGSHNKSREDRFLIGSVSNKVSKLATAPVVVVKNYKKRDALNILVATDGNDKEAILKFLELVNKENVVISIINAVSPIEKILPPNSVDIANIAEIQKEANRSGQDMVDDLARKIGERGFEISKKYIKTEKPTNILLEESKHYDVIVVGSRGKSAIGKFFLGSVSSSILQYSTVSTVIVR